MVDLVPVSRNNVKNEQSHRQSILLKFDTDTVWCLDTSISIPLDPALPKMILIQREKLWSYQNFII